MVFPVVSVWMWELVYKKKLSSKELMLLNCSVEEGSWESFEGALVWLVIKPIILKEISPEYSLEGLMLKLKLQYFGHLMHRTDSFEKTLMLGKIEGGRRDQRVWDGWMASPTQWTWVWASSVDLVMDREAWHAAVRGIAKSLTQLSNWTEVDWRTKECDCSHIPLYTFKTKALEEHECWQVCTSDIVVSEKEAFSV